MIFLKEEQIPNSLKDIFRSLELQRTDKISVERVKDRVFEFKVYLNGDDKFAFQIKLVCLPLFTGWQIKLPIIHCGWIQYNEKAEESLTAIKYYLDPFYTKKKCIKCDGTGHIKIFEKINGGICYKCNGKGII